MGDARAVSTHRLSTKCPDTPSECNLVIDDDYEENIQLGISVSCV